MHSTKPVNNKNYICKGWGRSYMVRRHRTAARAPAPAGVLTVVVEVMRAKTNQMQVIAGYHTRAFELKVQVPPAIPMFAGLEMERPSVDSLVEAEASRVRPNRRTVYSRAPRAQPVIPEEDPEIDVSNKPVHWDSDRRFFCSPRAKQGVWCKGGNKMTIKHWSLRVQCLTVEAAYLLAFSSFLPPCRPVALTPCERELDGSQDQLPWQLATIEQEQCCAWVRSTSQPLRVPLCMALHESLA